LLGLCGYSFFNGHRFVVETGRAGDEDERSLGYCASVADLLFKE